MPYRRKRRGKRGRKNALVVRVPRPVVSNKVHAFKRCVFSHNQSMTVPVGPGFLAFGKTFKLSDLPGYTEFTNLYDSYRILAVRYDIINQGISSGNMISNLTPIIHTIVDKDDATAPTTINEVMEDSRRKSKQWVGAHSVYIKPKIQNDNNGSQVISPKGKPWIDMSDAGVLHYGLKYMVTARTSANTTFYYDTLTTYYIQCKTPR